jgi:hypothetical protein
MGQLTISMAIFNSYVSLPEVNGVLWGFYIDLMGFSGGSTSFFLNHLALRHQI